MCSGHGNSAFTNFDGTDFLFRGNCSYVASKSDDYEIIILNGPCAENYVEKCTKNIPKDDDVACIQNSHARRIT